MEQQELFSLTPIAEKQIFSNYEIHDKKRLPIILSLIGISVIFHSIILAGAVLTPGIRDLFYLSALFNDARNTKTVSKDYDKTEIGDNYTVTMVDPNSLYKYPEGYFSTLDPNDPNVIAMTDKYTDTNSPVDLGGFNPTNPTIVPTPNNTYNPISPSGIKSIPPPRNYSPKGKGKSSLPPLPKGKTAYDLDPNSVAKEEDKNNNGIPDKYETNPNAEAKNGVKDKSNKDDKPKPEEKEKVTPPTENTASGDAPTKGEFNKLPFEKLGQNVKEQIAKNELDLNQPATVTLEGLMDKDGNLVPVKDASGKDVKFLRTNKGGDEKLVEAISRAIGALDESGFLVNLKELTKGAKKNAKVKFIIEKNQQDVVIQIKSDIEGKVSPESISSSLNVAIGVVKLTRGDKIEGRLLKNAEAKVEGKTVVIYWKMPSGEAMEMLQTQLANLQPPQQSDAQTAEAGKKKTATK